MLCCYDLNFEGILKVHLAFVYIIKTSQLFGSSFVLFLFLNSLNLVMEQDILKRMVLFCKAAVEVHKLYGFVTESIMGYSAIISKDSFSSIYAISF